MSLLLVAALTVSGSVQPHCSWDRPGVNPFMGDVVAAVDRYRDIPPAVRATLKKRVAARRYDEIATIRRSSVEGAYRYVDLRDMHFGRGTVCRSVSRDRWTDATEERGLVYCEDGHCLIVPTVCRNVSRITRVPMQKAQSAELNGPPEPTPEISFLAAPVPRDGELQFDAPAAGDSRSFASGLSDPTVPLPSGSASGLAYGSADPEPGSGSLPWGGLAELPSGAGPGSLGTGLPIAGVPSTAGDGPLGLPGAAPVPGVAPVPEPSTVALLGLGLGLVAWAGRRRLQSPG